MFERKSILAVLLGLIFFCFFGSLAASAWMFPHYYDWRYRVISNLLSPRDNPSHYWLPTCGVALAGLFTLPLARYLQRQLQIVSPSGARVSGGSFLIGIIMLICASVVAPQHMHAGLGIR